MNTPELDAPKNIVTRFFIAFLNERNAAVADELVSPAVAGPAGKGPEGYKAMIAPLVKGFPDLLFTIEEMIVEGSRVVVRWTSKGTHNGPFAGVAPTGRQVTNTGIAIYRVESGKIVENWSQLDRLGVLQQIGAVPPIAPLVPPSGATSA